MSLHIEGKPGDVADAVLLPGDPLRARFIAESYFEEPRLYNQRRQTFGYTGRYRGARVSVQATGMGIPSISIYVNELIAEFGAKTLVRVGTCGAIQPDLAIGDIVLAIAASTNSAVNRTVFGGLDFAPAADFDLLARAHRAAASMGIGVRVGTVLTSDVFYDRPGWFDVWAQHGVLVAEMETSALYTLAARHRARALAILTVSDSCVSGGSMDPADRERSLDRMARLALETVACP